MEFGANEITATAGLITAIGGLIEVIRRRRKRKRELESEPPEPCEKPHIDSLPVPGETTRRLKALAAEAKKKARK